MASVEVAEERKIDRPRSIRGLDVLCIAEGLGRRGETIAMTAAMHTEHRRRCKRLRLPL
jgi:hypothetical protein